MGLGRRVEQQRFVLEVLRREESLRRQAMDRRHDGNELVVEQRVHQQTAVLNDVIGDADIDHPVQEELVDLAAGAGDDLHVGPGTGRAQASQHVREPVVLRVAARRHAQAARLSARQASNRVLGAFEPVAEISSAERSEPLARARAEHHAFADAEKDLRAEMRFDVAQLMTERRLREVQLAPGARQSAERRDGASRA